MLAPADSGDIFRPTRPSLFRTEQAQQACLQSTRRVASVDQWTSGPVGDVEARGRGWRKRHRNVMLEIRRPALGGPASREGTLALITD